jgi:replicative DNA helicase
MSYDDRTPPQDTAAEMAVLGAMLISNVAIGEVIETMSASDHYRPNHELIHDAIVDLYTLGEAVDMVTVAAELTRRSLLLKVGGAPYLHTLASEVPIAANAAHYAEIVHEHAVRRRLIDAGIKIVQRGYSLEGDVKALLTEAEHALSEATSERSQHEDLVRFGDALNPALDELDALSYTEGGMQGISTGFIDLDELTGGFRPGQMVVVAGRPAMGKSTLAVDFARCAALKHGLATAVFSLEMTRMEIVQRVVSAQAKVTLTKMRGGHLDDQDWTRIAANMTEVMDKPLFIDDSANLTMPEIAAKARRLKATDDLRFMVIDYLQLMTSGKRVENRQTEVSEFSRQIKLLAKELEIPIVALSQLNRGPEQRTNKRPLMSDLRESGSIEQDADIIVLVHRDDAYEQESTRPGEADLILAKNRNGPTRDVVVAAQLHYSRFVDMAQYA